ncbi:putative selenium-dependent hydroxylase accessory protein YqeC [Heliobacterium gestii]|uniref:Putative selenium-dependent hydroxylase accessory protein YqeC n=1 Tax=Heliomicrobium gestii TaxID=2699 RepID=A0A845L9P9_HELGE|nr:selenium cofactor biosynthesis protein YqeC [Heliomicrobium gestii]MBM7866883.1 putative selenium-dependent hydroxylase accessory protein YqeC [Heliomicrobium gestii]MZP42311.1 putative selenium-dependent hydroxylase accessory protein YqeC [Heliomicrobium gestii]
MRLSEALGIVSPTVLSVVGAGGKTSLLMALSDQWEAERIPYVLTTTTRMAYEQVEHLAPIVEEEFHSGLQKALSDLGRFGRAGWFRSVKDGKVQGIPPEWVDRLCDYRCSWHLLIEADGAAGRLLKAPAAHEPVVPMRSDVTVGVLHLDAIGCPLDTTIVHRPGLVRPIVGKPNGALIEPEDLAKLALHRKGIFQGAAGKKILLLSGGVTDPAGDTMQRQWTEAIVDRLWKDGNGRIERVIRTKGYGREMRVSRLYRQP